MSEISWMEAIGYAIRYIIYVIVWGIIGGLFIFAGVAMMFPTFGSGYMGYPYPQFDIGRVILGLLVALIGYAIIVVGSMASYFKLMSKLISESIPSASLRPPPT